MPSPSSLQIPVEAPASGPSTGRYQPSPSSMAAPGRPVSVSVHPTPTSTATSPSRRQQRASHTVVSQHPHQDEQPAYHDVYSHPAAAAYAAAHPRRTIPKFGPYLLLQTLGEGEFGKVKLGLHMQWGEEVAVKLIRRGNVDSSVRMSKVEREIEVLRNLKHPNIVRLYDVIETDKYIGIILEYASGGELFDHILAHRYLKEKDAAKLFSQLISGVWYIHQKKIVHRDLKLENLLLDRHRNVIITDFGFANRFEHRSDDLMQTSCGSPCYAAPELVISEGLYVGSAVDIWSCGVILYAMLAGYLPFDDDPANPDGDNINLLYKYIVNTPLSFPEYISDEARDLLSMMLVPDPKRRADLSSVMAHPWLSGYSDEEGIDGLTTAFGKTVDELEQAAMEQHQLKRMAYQRQMKAAAAAAADPSRVARSQSQRQDVFASPPSGGRSRSTQPEYLYETSADQSSLLYPTTLPRGFNDNVDMGLPVSPVDMDADDPFAPPLAASAKISRALSPNDEGEVRGHPTPRKESKDDAPTRSKIPSPEAGKKTANDFRHTIQVEYDSPAKAPPQMREKAQTPPQAQANGERKRRPSQGSVTASKPLPVTPVSPVREREHATPTPHRERIPTNQTLSSPASTRSNRAMPEPPVLTVDNTILAGPVTPTPFVPAPVPARGSEQKEKDKDTVSQASSKTSQHRKGSLSSGGFGKIFGPSSTNGVDHSINGTGKGMSSRVPSDTSVVDVSKSPSLNGRPSTLQSPASSSVSPGSSLLLPAIANGEKEPESGKKSRRNTLTVMVEPISRSIKNRTVGRLTSAATGDGKEKEIPKAAVSSTLPPALTAPSSTGMNAPLGNVSRTDIGTGMQASTSKARKVMQWFRTKTITKEPSTADAIFPSEGSTRDANKESEGGDADLHEKHRGGTPTQAEFKRKNTVSISTINNQTPVSIRSPVQVFVTTPTSSGRVQAPSHPPRSASQGYRIPSMPVVPSLAARIRNSVTVGGGSVKGQGGMLRIHHGAVDQTTITTGAPPEVMKHVREVLQEMGVEIQLESEFKYRCIRAKKRKTSVTGVGETGNVSGMGVGGGGSNLAAFTMMGSAASNGVDKRGLPVPSPSSFHGTGGKMLRGLLMRRQSSQVSTSGPGSSQPSLSFDDEATANNSALSSEPGSMIQEPIYGDSTNDAFDEVRFSVELTRLDRLNDTFSLDIRRLKGNLRSYKFLYDTLRERADLQR